MPRSSMMLASLLLGFWLATLSACTYTAAVSQTNIPAARNKPVEAEVRKFIVLGFNFDNDEVYKLVEKLKAQCPGGQVRGILTQDMRTLYFLFFFWARDTVAKGYCVGPQRVANGDSEISSTDQLHAAQADDDGQAELATPGDKL